MKFHEALRRAVRQFGINVLQEHRLMSVLADYKAFDDYPAVKEVMKTVSSEGHGKELCRLAMDGSDEECLHYAEDLRKSLVRNSSFREEFAEYAAESLAFALGLRTSVQEPSDHGFEAVRGKNEPESAGKSRQRTEARSEAATQEERNIAPSRSDIESSYELYLLGEKYYFGRGVRQDYAKAAEYYHKAAELGNSRAAECLGYMYRDGRGVVRSLSDSQKWFSVAQMGETGLRCYDHAKLKDSAGNLVSGKNFYFLGEKYYFGRGVRQDYAKAAEYYHKAAELGNVKAAVCLGYMYRDGRGVARSQSDAEKWLRMAHQA